MQRRVGMVSLAGLLSLLMASGVLAVPAAAAAPPTTAPGAPNGLAVPLPPAAPNPAGPQISGFRSAHFGMREAAVRAAIGHDFHLPASAIHAGNNAVERTAILSVRVTDLAPGAGGAIVSYVFGYRSHALIEVNIVWSKASDPNLTPDQLAVIGARLQAYFAAEHYSPAHTAMNAPLADGVLLFRTVDPAGGAIALILSGPVRDDAKRHKRVLTPTALSLAYAVDAAHPDVFRLEKGSF
ncbi:MAG: hypothetical protein ACREFJ_20210 [Acetobacteraceae bacterium]